MKVEKLYEILLEEKPSILIRENEDYIFELIPDLKKCKNFNQNNIWHIYDVYEHILHVVDGVSNELILRLAALFHDIGKPDMYTEDENGVGHFYDHWTKSREIFEKFAYNFDLNDNIKDVISKLIYYHDINFTNMIESENLKLIKLFSKKEIKWLFELKRSDLLAQNEKFHYLLEDYKKQEKDLLLRSDD